MSGVLKEVSHGGIQGLLLLERLLPTAPSSVYRAQAVNNFMYLLQKSLLDSQRPWIIGVNDAQSEGPITSHLRAHQPLTSCEL